MNLWKHQQDLLDRNPSKWLLAWSTGTGKTGTALMLSEKNCDTTLIVCPKTLKENWRREVVRWRGISPLVFNSKHPPANFSIIRTNPIMIISKEEFRKFWDVLPGFDGIIIDEAHSFAGINSQLSKTMRKYIRKHLIDYTWLLTATPYLRNAWNIYVLGNLLGQMWEYSAFRAKFFYERYMGSRSFWEARPGMEEDIAALVGVLGSAVKLEDCIDMPEATYLTEYFKPTKEQEAATKKITETLPIVRFTKLHQICGGALKGNEYEPTVLIESEKVDRVKELAEENEKMIISCRYLAEMEMLHDVLFESVRPFGRDIFVMNGETKNKQELIDAYNASPKAILIVNAACSEGWSAADAKTPFPTSLIVFYSYDFSLKNKVQMEGRVRRGDLPQRVTYLSLLIEGSIDEMVFAALERKMDFDAAIYDYENNN